MSEIVTRTIRACGCALLLLSISSSLRAQEAATSTPVRISIPTEGVEALQGVATPTATRTPTPSVVVLEAKADAGPVNVRADADIEADRLGTIQAGEYYPVLGRRYRWLQFQFPSAPQGRAWVFEELVTLSGDESAIPDLLLATSEAPVQTQVNATLTQAALLRTPGAVLTLTAGARILPFPGQGSEPGGADPAAGGENQPAANIHLPAAAGRCHGHAGGIARRYYTGRSVSDTATRSGTYPTHCANRLAGGRRPVGPDA